MNNKQREILEKHFNIYEDTDNTELELEDWTGGGVDMLIQIDLKRGNIVEELSDYLNSFDIDEEIDLHRQDERYRNDFKITESVKDFEDWVEYIKNIIKQLKESD